MFESESGGVKKTRSTGQVFDNSCSFNSGERLKAIMALLFKYQAFVHAFPSLFCWILGVQLAALTSSVTLACCTTPTPTLSCLRTRQSACASTSQTVWSSLATFTLSPRSRSVETISSRSRLIEISKVNICRNSFECSFLTAVFLS